MTGTLVMLAITLILGGLAFAFRRERLGEAKALFVGQGTMLLGLLPVAFIVASFVGRLIPPEKVAPIIGAESGFRGILLACAVGGLVPGGPAVSFPLALVVWNMGAGTPQMVAFLTAWSCYGLHRVLAFEWAFMGPRFVLVRMASVLILPPLAALLSEIVLEGVWLFNGAGLQAH